MRNAMRGCLLAACWLLFTHVAGAAEHSQVKIVARLTAEGGLITDAALMDDEHLVLAYPAAGHLAEYTLDGQLVQHIVRESGAARRFRPTTCCATGSSGIAVYDEAALQVFFIASDGNFDRGVELAYQDAPGAAAIALSAVGDLSSPDGKRLWATLPERGLLACFDFAGQQKQRLDLGAVLPYPHAIYTRGQLLADGSLFLLDYAQGAVIYRKGAADQYHRLALGTPEGVDAAPVLNDMAVDERGNVVITSSLVGRPVFLLEPVENGYDLHTLELRLPVPDARLACRYSRGRFILWQRDQPYIILFELL